MAVKFGSGVSLVMSKSSPPWSRAVFTCCAPEQAGQGGSVLSRGHVGHPHCHIPARPGQPRLQRQQQERQDHGAAQAQPHL